MNSIGENKKHSGHSVFKFGLLSLGIWCAAGLMGSPPAYSSSSPATHTIEGVVKVAHPVSNSTIRVLDHAGHVLVEQAAATNTDGFFSVTVPNTEGPVEIQAKGGESEGHAFEGTLYGTVNLNDSSKDLTDSFVHLNVGTTLTAIYQDLNPKLSLQDAEARVHHFLELPEMINVEKGIENSYLTSFSAQTFEWEAKLDGGFDQLTHQLALEMSRDTNATRSFPAHVQLNAKSGLGPEWIGEKLLAGIAGNVGSQIFNKFLAGIGIPSDSDQILSKMNQVLAQLAEISNRLNRIETELKKLNYDVRSSSLKKKYQQYVGIADKMNDLNVLAKANTDATGHAKDTAKATEIATTARKYMKQLTDLDVVLVTDVYAEMTSSGDNRPLQEIFASFKFDETSVVDKDFYKLINDQVDQYRGYQAVVTALVVDALRVDNATDATVTLTTATRYINAEKPIYPSHPVFTSTYVDAIKNGKQFYTKSTNLIWDTTFQRLDICQQLLNQKSNPSAQFRSPSIEEISSMMEAQKVNGQIFGPAMNKLGFSLADTQKTKMITFNCIIHPIPPKGQIVTYNWFGNDQKGPWSAYENDESYFNKVRSDKQMGSGFWTMRVKTLK